MFGYAMYINIIIYYSSFSLIANSESSFGGINQF